MGIYSPPQAPVSEASFAWPNSKGLPLTGLVFKIVGGSGSQSYTLKADVVSLRSNDGDILTRTGIDLFGSIDATALDPDTRYYVYLATWEEVSGVQVLLSEDSERLGDTFTPPGLYTHFREVGEFFVDSGGAIIGLKRVGNRVTLEDWADAPIFTSGNFTNAYVAHNYPDVIPPRVESMLFLVRYTLGSTYTAMIAIADDTSGNQETLHALASINATNQTYKGATSSHSAERQSGGLTADGLAVRLHSPSSQTVNISNMYVATYEWSL